jgi:protein-disulfide isomerase
MQRNRLLLLGGAVVAAAVVVVVLILVLATGGGSSSATTTSSAPPASPASSSSLAGIPQHGDTLGRASAPATVLVFEDPQCPFCREWNVGTLPTVLAEYVRTGRIKLVYRGIEIIGPNSVKGLRAIYAAGAQNKLWNLVDALYAKQGAENSGWITDAAIREAAKVSGADGNAILAASSSPAVTSQLRQAAQDATRASVQGTPTFVVQRPPGLPQHLQLSALDAASFTAALDAALLR